MKQFMGLLIGLSGSFLGGLLGLGGGIIMVPLMTRFARLSQHKAHGTSLVAIVFTGLAGATTYFFHGSASLSGALMIAVSAVFTARLGAHFAHSLSEAKLRKTFGYFIICMSVLLLLKGYLPKTGFNLSFWATMIVFLLTGSAAGFLAGMMGVGGGAIMVPLMVLLGNMDQHLAQGTSLMAMVPASISGAATHRKLGNVKMEIALGLAVGSLIGGFLGATGAAYLPELYLRILFAAIGLWMGIRYVRS